MQKKKKTMNEEGIIVLTSFLAYPIALFSFCNQFDVQLQINYECDLSAATAEPNAYV